MPQLVAFEHASCLQMVLQRISALRWPSSTGFMLTIACLLGCMLAPSSANLLCSGSDPTCQVYLPEAAFYAQSNASNFVYDFFPKNGSQPTIISGNLFTPTDIPMVQLPSVDLALSYTWLPKGSASMPHYHSNAVEWGYMTKGSGYACMTQRVLTPTTSNIRFICNKMAEGSMYMIPPGWLHFLVWPCVDSQSLVGFNKYDFNNEFVSNAFEQPIPQDKYFPGAGVTVEEMNDLVAMINKAQRGTEFGKKLYVEIPPPDPEEFCAKYPAESP